MIFDYLLAFALIVQPKVDVKSPIECNTVAMRQTIREVAISLQILDKRDRSFAARDSYWGRNDLDYNVYSCELQELNKRYHDLKDAPPAHSFPNPLTSDDFSELIDFNLEYSNLLQEKLSLYSDSDPIAEEIREVIKECNRLYLIYYYAKEASYKHYYVHIHRRELKSLYEKVGPDMYYNGCLPPCVPIGKFWIIDY